MVLIRRGRQASKKKEEPNENSVIIPDLEVLNR